MDSKKTENRIQQEIFLWHWNNFPQERGMLFHVPNENQHRKRGIGVVAGVADLVLLKNQTAYFFELKTETGKQSPKQKYWEIKVKRAGYNYFIVRSLEDFIAIYKQISQNML